MITPKLKKAMHEMAQRMIEDKAKASDCCELLRGGEYNWKNQPERLKYIGKLGCWHQFEKIGIQGVWCEVLDEHLHMIEKTLAPL